MKVIIILILAALMFALTWAVYTAVIALALNGIGPYDFSFSTVLGFGLIATAVNKTDFTITSQR